MKQRNADKKLDLRRAQFDKPDSKSNTEHMGKKPGSRKRD